MAYRMPRGKRRSRTLTTGIALAIYLRTARSGSVYRNRCIAALVARLRPSGLLFDIGGGNGYMSDGLRSVGLEAVVVEPGIHGASARLALV